MRVGIMGVTMSHRRVAMRMAVRLAGLHSRRMVMLVVAVVHMPVGMFERHMGMLMTMCFGEVQPKSDSHEEPRADEGRGREISARAGSSEML